MTRLRRKLSAIIAPAPQAAAKPAPAKPAPAQSAPSKPALAKPTQTKPAAETAVQKLKAAVKKSPPASHRVELFHRLPSNDMTCPICGAASVTHSSAYPSERAPFKHWVTYFCTGCGTGFVPGASALLGDYYTSAYSQAYAADRLAAPEAYFDPAKRLVPERQVNRVKFQLAALAKQGARFGRVLDYGCGPGYFLHMAKPQEAFAIEMDTAAHPHLDYVGATRLTEADLASHSFDVIMMSHVAEHFDALEAKGKLAALLGALAPGGMLYIEVPQAGHSYLDANSRNDPHTILFTPEGLQRLIERAGGTVLRCFPRSRQESPLRDNPIYTPDPSNAFACVRGGGLSVIATGPRSQA